MANYGDRPVWCPTTVRYPSPVMGYLFIEGTNNGQD